MPTGDPAARSPAPRLPVQMRTKRRRDESNARLLHSFNPSELPARPQCTSDWNRTALSFLWFLLKSVATKVRGEFAEVTPIFPTLAQYFFQRSLKSSSSEMPAGGPRRGARRTAFPAQSLVSSRHTAPTTRAGAGAGKPCGGRPRPQRQGWCLQQSHRLSCFLQNESEVRAVSGPSCARRSG